MGVWSQTTWVIILTTQDIGGSSLLVQTVKNLPAMQGNQVRSLGQEDSPGEGNSNPLQYSCLGNPIDRGAWWSTSLRVSKSWT